MSGCRNLRSYRRQFAGEPASFDMVATHGRCGLRGAHRLAGKWVERGVLGVRMRDEVLHQEY